MKNVGRARKRINIYGIFPPEAGASDAVFSAHPVPLSVIELGNRNANNAIWDWPMMCTAVVNSMPW